MSTRRPNFLVAGAQKCGTTYLCAALARHPKVFHCDPKEPLFFQRADVDKASFRTYLQSCFSGASGQEWVGEGSTVYFQWPKALPNIRRYLGDELHVFVCLRHPTERAVSFYLHNVRKGRLSGREPIGSTGKDVKMSPVLSSRYADALERWLDAYGDQLRVLRFDDLQSDPAAFVAQATDHLGIAPLARVPANAVNKGFDLEWRGDRLTLAGKAATMPEPPAFSRAELEDLHAMFAEDLDRTEALLGTSLRDWRVMPDFGVSGGDGT